MEKAEHAQSRDVSASPQRQNTKENRANNKSSKPDRSNDLIIKFRIVL